MNRTQTSGRQREQKLNRWLMAVFAAVVLLGVIVQITMMVKLSDQSKRTHTIRQETVNLESRIENLTLNLNKYANQDRITARAKALGMQLPDETQLRVVNLPGLPYSTTAQSAENTGAGEME